jgi:radical SAM superfamily enzyme YgiQ (UPF0313 family)
MKVLLVMPHLRKKLNLPTLTYPILSLQMVAGATPKKYDVKIVDERWEKLNFNEKCDIVGISCLTYLVPRAYAIADEFRKRGVTVVLGGDHPSALPEESKQHADSVVIGEAEASWTRLLEDFENGKLEPFYRQTEAIPAEKILPANREAGSNRPLTAAIEATRGCPVGCEFCAVSHRKGGNVYRTRPIEAVINEIKSIKNKHIFFFSPSMTANPPYSKKLFKEMIGLNKQFSCYGNANVLRKDEELLDIASRAGCIYWIVGFESISQENIDSIGKRTNKVQEYVDVVEKIHQYKMKILGNFVYGFDHDTKSIFDDTIKIALDINLDLAQFSILTPFPGTPLFERLEREGRLLSKDWSKYTEADVVFKHTTMTAEELIEGGMKSYREFYKMGNIIRRTLKNKSFDLAHVFNTWKLRNLDYRIYYKKKGLTDKDFKEKFKST